MDQIAQNNLVAEALDAAIRAAGGTQGALAEKLSCAQQTVGKLRSGEIPMTADWALRISRAVEGAVAPSKFVPELAQIASLETGASAS